MPPNPQLQFRRGQLAGRNQGRGRLPGGAGVAYCIKIRAKVASHPRHKSSNLGFFQLNDLHREELVQQTENIKCGRKAYHGFEIPVQLADKMSEVCGTVFEPVAASFKAVFPFPSRQLADAGDSQGISW